jgi:hypothetical protein
MGLFKRDIDAAYSARTLPPPAAPSMSISSPWSPQDTLVTFAADALPDAFRSGLMPMTRETALKVPGVKRAHGIVCATFAGIPFYQMDNDKRTAEQPEWLTNSQSGVAPYHRLYGMASDWFFNGWACLGFTADLTDALHIPVGMWKVDDDGFVVIAEGFADRVPQEYTEHLVAIPLGWGENGLLTDGADTLRQARQIESAYQDRLDNPIPLTILNVPAEILAAMTDDEVERYVKRWSERRRSKDGAIALKAAEWPVDMPGQVQVDLYETGRNGVRIDIANHTAVPASMIEGLRQGGGGGGTEMRYQGVGAGGAARSEFWDFGMPKRMVGAFEARTSLDDICEPGLSIRADLTGVLAAPNPTTNPTSED